jgi:hypothetical protein
MIARMEEEVGKGVSLDECARDGRDREEKGGFCTVQLSPSAQASYKPEWIGSLPLSVQAMNRQLYIAISLPFFGLS